MKSLCLLLLAAALPLCSARGAPASTPKPAPGPVNWLKRHIPLPVFGGKKEPSTTWKQLALTLIVEPMRPKLAETRQLRVTIRLANKGKKLVQLEFPTSQRFEVVLRNPAGKPIERWSDDHAIVNEPAMVTINPGERLEYFANLSTRDMAAGQSCTVEVSFLNYEQLRATRTVAAE